MTTAPATDQPPAPRSSGFAQNRLNALSNDPRFLSVAPYALGELLQHFPDLLNAPWIPSVNLGRIPISVFFRFYISGACGLFFWCTCLNRMLDPEHLGTWYRRVTFIGLLGLFAMEAADCDLILNQLDWTDITAGSVALLLFHSSFRAATSMSYPNAPETASRTP